MNPRQKAYHYKVAVNWHVMLASTRVRASEAKGKGAVAQAMRKFDGFTYRTALEKLALDNAA